MDLPEVDLLKTVEFVLGDAVDDALLHYFLEKVGLHLQESAKATTPVNLFMYVFELLSVRLL